MKPFDIVRGFEEELSNYTGAPYVVSVDSCSNALFLCFIYEKLFPIHWKNIINLPKRTYIGVAQAALNAGMRIEWIDDDWKGSYMINPTRIIDSARWLTSGMYQKGTFTCLSFQISKHISMGKGGAILTDNKEAADWFRRARFDGRTEGADVMTEPIQTPAFHMYLDPISAARGLWLLSVLPKNNPPQEAEYRDLSLIL
jgi:dTDP-4-amino-4,6-dideoxygalactose transaminase